MYEALVKTLREQCQNMDCGNCNTCVKLKAADAIEELSKPRWNPVTERLPKPGEESLVLVSKSGMEVALYEEGIYGEAEWFTTSGKLEGVTHWMPLPEPPKEEAPAGPYDLLYEEGGYNSNGV